MCECLGQDGIADAGADGLERKYFGGSFEIGRGFGHAVDDGGSGILCDRKCAGVSQGKQARRSAIAAHASKQDADADSTVRMGEAGEERIDGWTVGGVAGVGCVTEKAAARIVFFIDKVAAGACYPDSARG